MTGVLQEMFPHTHRGVWSQSGCDGAVVADHVDGDAAVNPAVFNFLHFTGMLVSVELHDDIVAGFESSHGQSIV